MKTHILYNPLSGSGDAARRRALDELCATIDGETEQHNVLEECKDEYASFFTEIGESDDIVLSGGDGTLNRFINYTEGDTRGHRLRYFACGTGNDFMKDVGGGDKPLDISAYIRDLPVVTVNGKDYKFINGVGYGIDGYCCEVGDALKAEGKEVNYTSIAIKGLFGKFKPCNATVTVDGVERRYKKVWLAPAMLGRYYGGGMMPAPDQNRLNEERTITVMVMHGSGKLRTLMMFPSIFKGEHVRYKKHVDLLKGHEITVRFDKPCALQIDGETILNVSEYTAKWC